MARPERRFTDEELQGIERYARINCNTETIADGMNIPVTTLKRRYGRKLTEWRAAGKLDMRDNLHKQSLISPQTAIFIAKNELDMVDKQTITTVSTTTKPTEEKAEAYKEAAKILKLRLAKGA